MHFNFREFFATNPLKTINFPLWDYHDNRLNSKVTFHPIFNKHFVILFTLNVFLGNVSIFPVEGKILKMQGPHPRIIHTWIRTFLVRTCVSAVVGKTNKL